MYAGMSLSVRACMCFTKREENEWGVKEITLQFLQGIRRNQASAGQGAPKGLLSISFSPSLSLTVIPAPHPHPSLHKHTYMQHTQPNTHSHTHTVVYGRRGYLSLSNKDSATADISHPRQLGHNLGLNVWLVCLCI